MWAFVAHRCTFPSHLQDIGSRELRELVERRTTTGILYCDYDADNTRKGFAAAVRAKAEKIRDNVRGIYDKTDVQLRRAEGEGSGPIAKARRRVFSSTLVGACAPADLPFRILAYA